MKTILQICASIALGASLHAATWTVDNVASRPADFRTIQAAIDAAAVGDTILVAGSSVSYSGFTLTKRLILKGPGISTIHGGSARVAGSDNIILTEVTDTLDPNHGRNAGGTVIEGLRISVSLIIESSCPNVSLSRTEQTGGDTLLSGANTLAINCYFSTTVVFNGINSAAHGTFMERGCFTASNVLLQNCVLGITTNGSGSAIFNSGSIFSGGVIFNSQVDSTIRNSILLSSSDIGVGLYTGAIFDHCLALGHRNLPQGNGNMSLPPTAFSTVFVGTPGPTGLQLKEGSPAIGAGKNGVDLGVWAGSAPFVQDLIPALPRISGMVAPVVVPDSSGLIFEVTAEARD